MPTFKQTPASIRYFKARLNILKRPMVWAAASSLILLVFLVGEYLANPQQYMNSNELEATTNPPNQKILGNLPPQNVPASNSELFETLPDLSTLSTQTRSDSQSNASESSLLQEFLLSRSSVAAQKAQPKRSSPSSLLSTSSENRRDPCDFCGAARPSENRSPGVYPVAPLLSKPSSAIFSEAVSSSTSSAISPAVDQLQSALDRYSSAAISQTSAVPPVESLANNGFRNVELLTTEGLISQDSQPELSSQKLPRSLFTPQRSPLPGTTGYTLPSTLQTPPPNINPFFSDNNLQPVPGQIASPTTLAVPRQFYGQSQTAPTRQTAYPKVQPTVALPSPMAAPFSVPHAAPGRFIGGGQINTFSNP